MSPLMVWLQLYRFEVSVVFVVLIGLLLAFIAWLFIRGERKARSENPIPPADQALMEMPEDEYRVRTGRRSEG